MIQTIKIDNTFYTFDDTHDDPKSTERYYQFPNDQVGTGISKLESQEVFRKVENSNAEIRNWAEWIQVNDVDAYMRGEYKGE